MTIPSQFICLAFTILTQSLSAVNNEEVILTKYLQFVQVRPRQVFTVNFSPIY